METITATRYYKDFEVNILAEDAAGEIRIGFSLDSKCFFISDGSRWYKYQLTEV